MDNEQMLNWLTLNIPEWPMSKSNQIRTPDGQWHWWLVGSEIVVLDIDTGDFIDKDTFLTHRHDNRLQTCGMDFKELLEDFNR
ncbi:hypothetical protein VPHK165_0090 [Vibrio phage K165]|nr:hypothetical protein MYOV022v2_p0072 [Vibrio phage 12E28.1]QZI90241.1 hypothetical protein MYOV021v2_p0072 [Vibrio phage 18E29.1]QZI90607.1 hypothetical protein MYOV023v1_p0060 [Vibrio phage 91E28.1a]QZI90644.1 hypothetical protein MYOV020v1_p0018 [Vibrio phage 98E28.6a]